jgi:hypothetical protein
VDGPPYGRPKEFHAACRKFHNHLHALVVLSESVKPDDYHALLLRRQLFAVVNGLPSHYERVRDNWGRFIRRGS